MPRARKKIMYAIGGVLLVILMIGGAWGWQVLRVEDIPEELGTMVRSPDEVILSSAGQGPDLHLVDLRGKTSVIVFEGVQSMRSEQGKQVNRALNRWILPEDTQPIIVWDGEGMRIFEDKAQKFVGFFAQELRFPIYVDWDGELVDVFKVVKGHHGLIVLGPEGEVVMRHSGGLEGDALEELRVMLGAEEPPPPEPAPEFSLGGVDKTACIGKGCMFVFLGTAVDRGDIPWIEDGFEGTRTECFERMRRPEIRLAAAAIRVPITKVHGVVAGKATNLRLEGWTITEDATAAREAFGFTPEDSGLVVIDKQGRMAFRKTGFIPMYEWTLAVDTTGEKIKRDDE